MHKTRPMLSYPRDKSNERQRDVGQEVTAVMGTCSFMRALRDTVSMAVPAAEYSGQALAQSTAIDSMAGLFL